MAVVQSSYVMLADHTPTNDRLLASQVLPLGMRCRNLGDRATWLRCVFLRKFPYRLHRSSLIRREYVADPSLCPGWKVHGKVSSDILFREHASFESSSTMDARQEPEK